MKTLTTLLIATAFMFQACGNGTEKTTTEQTAVTESEHHSSIETQTVEIPSEFTSLIRPGEKLELGKTYTDTLTYTGYDDNGDDWLFFVARGTDTLSLIYNNNDKTDLFKGEEIEVQWKVDSIRYAGDSEFLNYREFLVSAKRLQPYKLTNKNVKFLWRETHYDEEYETDISRIYLDHDYISTISEPEKAALAYVATFIGNECAWDGKVADDRSNLKCSILWALDLGYQCSYEHLGFLRFWFRNNEEILDELEACPTMPDGATVQDTFEEINIAVESNTITVSFKANGFNMREQRSWNWTEKMIFEFKENELLLLSDEKSPLERHTFEVTGN